MTDAGEKLAKRLRQWLISGGAGFEDGEDGIRACTMSAEAALEIAEEAVRAELERAAEIAEQLIGQSGGVAAAIRKLKE